MEFLKDGFSISILTATVHKRLQLFTFHNSGIKSSLQYEVLPGFANCLSWAIRLVCVLWGPQMLVEYLAFAKVPLFALPQTQL